MRQSDTPPLRRWLGATGGPPRYIWSAYEQVALTDLIGGSSFGGQLGSLRGHSVLIATREQLTAAVAMIELDGIARRVVICPPDVNASGLRAIVSSAEIDAVVSDDATHEWEGLGVTLHVKCSAVVEPRDDIRGRLAPSAQTTEWVLLTAGTTGVPKLVAHTLASLIAPIEPGTKSPIWGTFYDIRRYGGMQIVLRALIGGGSLILSSAGESVTDHLARLGAHGVTHLSGTPSHWWRALMGPAAQLIAPRYVRLSGEIASQAVLDNLRAVFPHAGLGHAFASTEAGVGFEVEDGLEGFPAHFVEAGADDVGIKIENGTLRLRSLRAASKYIGANAPILLDKDGFVDTGDIVELHGNRYYFVGRKDGVINVGGLKVHPEEIEAAINRHASVSGSLVKSRKSPITGSIVVAEVVLKDDADCRDAVLDLAALQRDIINLCRRDLAPYKVPAVLRFVPALPVSPTGKLLRHA